jgi:hypothetical protein
MVRLASLFTLACLALAASALLTTSQTVAEELPPNKEKEPSQQPKNRCFALASESSTPFHARFSLN